MSGPTHVREAAQVRSEIWQRRQLYSHVLRLAASGANTAQMVDQLARLDPPIVKTERQIRQVLSNAMKQMEKDQAKNATEAVSLELSRLDQLMTATFPRAMNTNDPHQLKAVEAVLKLMERRAKYLGLDAPDRHEHIIKTGLSQEERAEADRMNRAWLESGAVDSTAEELPADPATIEPPDGPRPGPDTTPD